MWQLTDQSSSSLATSPSSWVELKSNSTEDDDQEKQVVKKNTLIEISSQMERCEENGAHASILELGKEEVAPLIHLEDGEDDNWEAALLETNSLNNSSHEHRMNFLIYPNSFSNGYGDGQGRVHGCRLDKMESLPNTVHHSSPEVKVCHHNVKI
ncbi:hypothetical protein OIU84_019009 [Salix udensis]|uniref:Uncharacterized protein n=1 Tax=Salix udensis TaxID=889485 RepID=A0AAD6PIJ7_9ROSI|nr:hypothetical protein OIU84_019009 [Salix udensis]